MGSKQRCRIAVSKGSKTLKTAKNCREILSPRRAPYAAACPQYRFSLGVEEWEVGAAPSPRSLEHRVALAARCARGGIGPMRSGIRTAPCHIPRGIGEYVRAE